MQLIFDVLAHGSAHLDTPDQDVIISKIDKGFSTRLEYLLYIPTILVAKIMECQASMEERSEEENAEFDRLFRIIADRPSLIAEFAEHIKTSFLFNESDKLDRKSFFSKVGRSNFFLAQPMEIRNKFFQFVHPNFQTGMDEENERVSMGANSFRYKQKGDQPRMSFSRSR